MTEVLSFFIVSVKCSVETEKVNILEYWDIIGIFQNNGKMRMPIISSCSNKTVCMGYYKNKMAC